MKKAGKTTSNIKDYFRSSSKNKAVEQSTNENWTSENVAVASCSTEKIAPFDTNETLTSESEAFHRPKSSRLFQEGWLQNFPWLRYDKLNNTMSCSICIEANTPTNWREGISLMKKDCCVRHASSNAHIKSLKVSKLQGTMVESLRNAAVQSEDCFISVMQNTYWLAKENIAIYKSTSLNNHVNTILKQFGKSIESPYISDTSAWIMVEAISEILELEMISKIKEAKYFSLCADESTDISTSKNLIIYCKYFELPQNEVVTKFLTLLKIKDGSAQSVFDAIVNYLNKCNIELKYCVGWASDGASVMMGHRNGVQIKLKNVSPCLVSIHDPGHRENLAIADAYENLNYLKHTVDGTLRDINIYFCRSPNRKEELKFLQELLEEPQLQMKKLYSIRWLARYDCMNAVRKCLKSLMELFREDTTDPLALGIYAQLTSYKFFLIFHAMCDIINNLAVLSKFLQRSDLHPYEISPVINSTINNIENSFASEESNSLLGGIHVSTFHKYFKDSDYPLLFNQCVIHYKNLGKEDEKQASLIIKTFSKNIVNNLKLRFSDIKNFDTWKIFDSKQIPSEKQAFVQHGIKELKQICNLYCHPETGIFEWTFDVIQGEYQIFKEYVYKEAKNLQLTELCKLFILQYGKAFPHIVQLMKLCLVLPVGSVDCERGFSQQNLIKTKTRSRLASEHLDNLLRIRLNGPPSEMFDFKSAAMAFNKKIAPKKGIKRAKVVDILHK